MTLFAAMDTATDVGSVAVGTPGEKGPAAEVVIGRRRHAGDLVPAFEETLRLAGAEWSDLAGIIVADGPGSFTGLRIGFATAAGILRQHPAIPLYTVPSLIGTARLGSTFAAGPVAALYDALRGEVHAAVCEFGDRPRVLVPPRLTTVKALESQGFTATVAVGDGAALYADDVRRWTGREPVGPPGGAPRASLLIDLLKHELAIRVPDVAAWEPNYGRPAEAQARWERAHGRALPGAAGD